MSRIVETGLPFVFLGQVGGQDELVFDGASFVLNADRSLAVQMPHFAESITLTEWTRHNDGLRCTPQPLPPEPDRLDLIYRCMMTGLRDYVDKNRFPGVLLGLSGGIDSALSAAVAVDALGPDRVRAVMLPSPYTSQHSLDDAAGCAQLLGIRCDTVPITPAMDAVGTALDPLMRGRGADTTEENVQSRARGLLLMALSNKFGDMVLTTGNKSEMSVGYATLYGDMCGGYSVLKDVYKTTVFALCRWRNAHVPPGALGPAAGPVMPERVITKPPVRRAEARPDRPGHPAALRRARRHPAGPRRGRGLRRWPCRGRPRPQHRAARVADARPRRVQAPAGPARRQDHPPCVWPRPPLPHHQRLHRPDRMNDAPAPPSGTPSPGTWHVRIVDLSDDTGDNVVEEIGPFDTVDDANLFARRYVRDSVERCRAQGMDAKSVLDAWFAFGEDATVPDAGPAGWTSATELHDFAARRAAPADRDWRSLDPRTGGDEDED